MVKLRKRKESRVINEAIKETGGVRLWRIEYTYEQKTIFAALSPHQMTKFPTFSSYEDAVAGIFSPQTFISAIDTHIRENEKFSISVKENWKITDRRGILIQDIDLYFPSLDIAYDVITPASLIEISQGRVKNPCRQLSDFPGRLYYAVITDYQNRSGVITDCRGLSALIDEVKIWNIYPAETLKYAGLGKEERHLLFRDRIQKIARRFNFIGDEVKDIFHGIRTFNQVHESKVSRIRNSDRPPLLW